MNRFTATNTAPVTQNVRLTVSSIVCQLEAMGVNHQGFRKWNATVPITSNTSASAIAMRYSFCRSWPPGGSAADSRVERTERIDEMPVDRHQFGFGMALAHHLVDRVFLLLQGIDQDQELAGFEVVMEPRELAVLDADADQPAFPGAEQRRHADQGVVDECRYLDADGIEVIEQDHADQPDQETEHAADDAVANDIQRLEIIAGVDVLLLQPGFVTRNDVDEEVLDAGLVQVVRNDVGAVERRRQIVKALHLLPPLKLWSRPSSAKRGYSSPQNQASSPKPNKVIAMSANGSAGAQIGM